MSRRLDSHAWVTHRHVLTLLLIAGCAPPASNATAAAHPVGSSDGSDAGVDASAPSDDDDDDDDDGDDETYVPDPPPDPDDEPDASTEDPTPNDDGGPSGWTPTSDAGYMEPPDPVSDGGVIDPGDCRALAHNVSSGPFGTTDAVCFTVAAQPPVAWAAYHMDGRTVTVNGTPVSVGQLPFPGSAPFVVAFSAGTYDYTAWSYW
jgi:hypothetical protein